MNQLTGAEGKAKPAEGFFLRLLQPSPVWLGGFSLRRAILALVAIGGPLVVGLLRGESTPALVGCVTGILLTLSDTEGGLWQRLGTTLGVAIGIAVGGLLGARIAGAEPMFWLIFFTGIFAAGLLNLVGKGPHFAVRFGAIAFAVTTSLLQLAPEAEWYWAGTVALVFIAKLIDQLANGPLPAGPPWPGSISADRSYWIRFGLAYASAATAGLWIGVQAGSVRAVWIAAIVLVMMLPDLRVTYTRIFEGMIGTLLAVLLVLAVTSFGHAPAWLAGVILLLAFVLPSQLPRFWLFSGLIAAIVLLAWDIASLDPTVQPGLLWERFIDTVIAAILVMTTTLLFFPSKSWSSLTAFFREKL
jgi:hypothetical protein